VVDLDLSQFFDRVNHDIMMGLVSTKVTDPRVLLLIRRYLEAGMMDGGLIQPRLEGTPQGATFEPAPVQHAAHAA
jgi:retron-type reverse transcriptase